MGGRSAADDCDRTALSTGSAIDFAFTDVEQRGSGAAVEFVVRDQKVLGAFLKFF